MGTFNLEYFKKKLNINQHGEIRIVSDSMSPLIKSGEILKIIPLPSKLDRFDIVLFNYQGEPYCHFFWGINSNDQICTKSLKSPQKNDFPISKNNLIGVIANKKITFWQKVKVYFHLL